MKKLIAIEYQTENGIFIDIVSELIQCEDCRYSDGMPISDGRYWCEYNIGYFKFCSEGERKKDDYTEKDY